MEKPGNLPVRQLCYKYVYQIGEIHSEKYLYPPLSDFTNTSVIFFDLNVPWLENLPQMTVQP